MTAHPRTVRLTPGTAPAVTLRTSTGRLVLIAATSVLEAVIVLGFVSSSLGLGTAPYPDPDHGWATPAPSVVPVAPAIELNPAPVLEPAPAPAPAP
jgi:hypothetical protein